MAFNGLEAQHGFIILKVEYSINRENNFISYSATVLYFLSTVKSRYNTFQFLGILLITYILRKFILGLNPVIWAPQLSQSLGFQMRVVLSSAGASGHFLQYSFICALVLRRMLFSSFIKVTVPKLNTSTLLCRLKLNDRLNSSYISYIKMASRWYVFTGEWITFLPWEISPHTKDFYVLVFYSTGCIHSCACMDEESVNLFPQSLLGVSSLVYFFYSVGFKLLLTSVLCPVLGCGLFPVCTFWCIFKL